MPAFHRLARNVLAVQRLLGHTGPGRNVRYLGNGVDGSGRPWCGRSARIVDSKDAGMTPTDSERDSRRDSPREHKSRMECVNGPVR
ncbi:hypothetical protein CYJ10_16205 [Cupriavidus pauculus]|uniref:Uncharacterized protein n=1 Tax=Cupriavidus pauculus TaxID=82633 RepID=A0A2N5CAX9_9BURK|nr:hypothetical protein CYJ10_16205 [Cupriavidus pauculus]